MDRHDCNIEVQCAGYIKLQWMFLVMSPTLAADVIPKIRLARALSLRAPCPERILVKPRESNLSPSILDIED